MIGLYNYLNYAAGQGRKLVRYEGILIYDPAFGNLPQDVLFMPIVWNHKNGFEDFLIKQFSNEKAHLYQVYFQGIRWILPDLEKKLSSCGFVEIQIGLKPRKVKATYAALTFDETTPAISEDEDHVSKKTTLPMIIKHIKLETDIIEIPPEFGYLKLFEPILI